MTASTWASPSRTRRAGWTGLPRLRHGRDWQSIAYLLALPLLVAWQWWQGWHPVPYALVLFLTLGTGVIHHNHTHARMWHGRWANRLTDYWLTLLQGHPTFVFWPAHVANHHRFRHGPCDATRTYRFGGDHNHLWGYLSHPVLAAWVLYPLFIGWLGRLRRRWPGAFHYCMGQYALWLGSWALLLAIDWQKALVLVIVPQLHGLHWLLATNYLQHAHADGRPVSRSQRLAPHAPLNYARNFEGLVNPLLFNIGLHTAHHEHPHAHWSELVRLHRQHYQHRVDPALSERGLLRYMLRVFVLGIVWPPARSRPQMPTGFMPE
ncbi:fatty acid desaturase [Corticibacter populi]|uniref:Fatty acid desaturase n=1 Tax=Corticibacter populi TaxID=1550736 RepID=A0A3M6R061_9BURK|nr:fatty acid desaturase [Corticibacter populi]RMX08563.1 fatty acid desaturase [Corticibacter populi]RZS35885.1 fatty acid desaturase [Corticibacter populi]